LPRFAECSLHKSWPSLEYILPELKTVLPNACLRQGFGRQADFVIEGYVDPREPLRDEGASVVVS